MNHIPPADDREHRLIEAVVAMAKSFREERDRLARRLSQLEEEIDTLAVKLDQRQHELSGAALPAGARPGPSRTPS